MLSEKTTMLDKHGFSEYQRYDSAFMYQMLDRLRADCGYYLGNGNRYARHLWTHDEKEQIQLMREIYAILPEPPEWLTLEQIDQFEKEMIGTENGRDA